MLIFKQINKQDDQIINISLSLHLDGNVKTTKKITCYLIIMKILMLLLVNLII